MRANICFCLILLIGSFPAAAAKKNALTDKRSTDLVRAAQRSSGRGDWQIALDQLEEAKHIDPSNPVIYFNEAVVYDQIGDRAKAIQQLDLCIFLAPEGRKKEDAEIFRSRLITPEPTRTSPSSKDRTAFQAVNRAFRKFHTTSLRDVTPPGRLPCVMLDTRDKDVASLAFDRAFCHEVRGDFTKAVASYRNYIELVPTAEDIPQVRTHIAFLSDLLTLQGEQGAEIRKRYGAVTYFMSGNRFDLALRALQEIEYIAPQWPEVKERIAVLANRLGDFQVARHYYSQLSTFPQYAEAAEQHLDEIAWNEPKYRGYIAEAARLLGQILSSRLRENSPGQIEPTFTIPQPTGTDPIVLELEQALHYISAALAISDLGSEPHALLTVVFQLTHNPILVARSEDVLYAHNDPVFFFDVNGDRVEITATSIRVLDISKVSYGGRVMPRIPGQLAAVKYEISTAAISAISVRERKILIYAEGGAFLIEPAALHGAIPDLGPLARRHANSYLHLLSRYVSADEIRYGVERLNRKEILAIAGSVAMLAATIYEMTQTKDYNGVHQGAWQRLSHLNDVLKYYRFFRSSAPVVLHIVQVLRQKQDIEFLPTFKLLPAQKPLLRLRALW